MAFDYKKEYKGIYNPPKKPMFIDVPPINYVAVRGSGDPNQEGGEYQQALQLLYGVSFTIKMSPKAGHKLEGYFEYVVPPLEGFWKLPDGVVFLDPSRKDELEWISCIRLPEFVTPEILAWAKDAAAQKKKADFSAAEFLTVDEGSCAQCMHIGPYDDEPSTIERMQEFAEHEGHAFDLTPKRFHHEIYLSDPRRTAPEKLKTVIRIPIA